MEAYSHNGIAYNSANGRPGTISINIYKSHELNTKQNKQVAGEHI